MHIAPTDPAVTPDEPATVDPSDLSWLTAPLPNGNESLTDLIGVIDELEMYELGEVYVSLRARLAQQPADSEAAERLRAAIHAYWERLDDQDEDALYELLCGIHEGLTKVFDHNRAIALNTSSEPG